MELNISSLSFLLFFSIKNNFDYFLFCMICIAITFYLLFLFWIFPVYKFNFGDFLMAFQLLTIAQYNLMWFYLYDFSCLLKE